jgi:hypothetical protein
MGAADLVDELFGSQLAQVVGGVADRVVVAGLAGDDVDLGGELANG